MFDYRENCGIILGCNSMREHLIYGELFEGHLRDVVKTCDRCGATHQGDFVVIYHTDDTDEIEERQTVVCEVCHRYL